MDFQASLFAGETAAAAELSPERRILSRGAWVDVQRNWLRDPDDVFAALVQRVPWRAERREMYDSVAGRALRERRLLLLPRRSRLRRLARRHDRSRPG